VGEKHLQFYDDDDDDDDDDQKLQQKATGLRS
jgi:hypothetical protein